MIQGLTPRQADMLAAIRRLSQGGVAPSFHELAYELDLESKSGVHRLLVGLQERGLIQFTKGRARSIRILGEMEGLERRSTADLHVLRARIDAILKVRAQ